MRHSTLNPSHISVYFHKLSHTVVCSFRQQLQLRGQFRILTGFPIKPLAASVPKENTIYSFNFEKINNM